MKLLSFLLLFFPSLLFAQGKLEVTQENPTQENPRQIIPQNMILVETADGIRLIENPDHATNDNAINEENNTIILPNEPNKKEENSLPEIKSERL